MTLKPLTALVWLSIALSRRNSSTEAYDVHPYSASSLHGKPLSGISTMHSISSKRFIKGQRRFVSFWLNSRNAKYKNNNAPETRQRRITAPERYTLLSFQSIANKVPQISKRTATTLRTTATQYWWSLPLTLCMIPIFCGPVSTPQFWKMVQFDYILECPDAAFVIGTFLGSNLSYFLAGYRIFYDLPPRRKRFFCPYGGLAFWIWAAGLVSTIFHAVQSMGRTSLPYAEALYYVDHGIAGAAVFYFYHICGLPNRYALALGVAGLVCLALPLRPGYAWLHSLWHVLSAAAAWMWTCQGKVARRKQLLSAVRDRVDYS